MAFPLRRPALILLTAAGASTLLGCAGGGSDSSRSTSMGSMFTGRPRVSVSVAESHPSPGVEQLDFFDTLERRDLVSHDDALHATLLLFTGQSGETFVQRAGRAKQKGMLDPKFDRHPREAVTVGELSQLLTSGMHRPSAGSASSSMSDLKDLGVLPAFAQENSGVSGSQLLTILGHTEDAMASGAALPAPTPPPPTPTPVPAAAEPPPAPPVAERPAEPAPTQPLTPPQKKVISPAVFSERPSSQPEKKPVKKPPIDLERDAKKPREGQVLPDSARAAEPAPAPSNEATPTTPAPATPPPAPVRETTPAPAAPAASTSGPKPLPPPRADGGVPSRVDGSAADLRYVAVDRVEVEATEIRGPGEFAQWRSVDDGRGRPGEWQTLQEGVPISDRIEVRTGLGSRVALKVDDSVIVLHRLSRARLERKVRSDGKTQIGVTMYRGLLEATAPGAADQTKVPVYVRTPDQVFPLRTRALFEYDAFKGTIAQEFRSPSDNP